MNMKKTLVLLLTLALTVGMLAGCGGNKEEPKEPVDIQPEVVLELSELEEKLEEANGLYDEVLVKVQEAEQYENDLKAAQEVVEATEVEETTEDVEDAILETEEVTATEEEVTATEEEVTATAEDAVTDEEVANTELEETDVVETTDAPGAEETEKTRVEEVLVELGNIREGLDRVSAKIELEDYETQEEIDADVANVNLFIESLTELQEEFTDTEVVEGNTLTIVNKLDKEIKSITLSYNTNEDYGLNILAENDVLAVDSETSVLFRYSENEELEKWFIKVITADDVETELEGVEITEDTKLEIGLDTETEEITLKIAE